MSCILQSKCQYRIKEEKEGGKETGKEGGEGMERR
jgi:hypothetical protein